MTPRRVFWAVVVLLVVGYLLSGVTQVRPGERAVVRRFGRVLDFQPEPGLWIGLPWGMDRVDRVPIDQVRRVEVGYQPDADEDNLTTPSGQLLTGDHNLVNLQVVLNYAVQPDAVEDYVVHATDADGLVARAAETAMAEWVAGRTVDEVLLRGKVDLPPWLVGETQRRLSKYHLGVVVRDASVSRLLPPPQVKASFDQVTQSQTEIRTRLNSAEQEAQRSVQAAEAEKYRLEQLAAAYANEQTVLARAEADSFERRLRQYQEMKRDNPDALTAIWWDEMGKLYAKLREGGRVDLLDHHLGPDGLDITVMTPPKKK
jgi:modulator of FtsH protease HflK